MNATLCHLAVNTTARFNPTSHLDTLVAYVDHRGPCASDAWHEARGYFVGVYSAVAGGNAKRSLWTDDPDEVAEFLANDPGRFNPATPDEVVDLTPCL